MSSQCLGTHYYVQESNTCVLKKAWFKPFFPCITVIACVLLIGYAAFIVTEYLMKKKFEKEEKERLKKDRIQNEVLKDKYKNILNARNSQQSANQQQNSQQRSVSLQSQNQLQRNMQNEQQQQQFKDDSQHIYQVIQNF